MFFKVELRPEVKKGLKDPERFARGLGTVYTGLAICMTGVAMMLVLYFTRPEHVLHPTWLLFIGLGMAFWGEWVKSRSK